MHPAERLLLTVRHHPALERAEWLWRWVRPWYNGAVQFLGRRGIERVINQTDPLLVLPEFRGVAESYEPEVWAHLMTHLRPGDTVADVGAFIGLYTVALAKRAGASGRIIAYEPDPDNCATLKAHLALNKVTACVEVVEAAVSDHAGQVSFQTGEASQSRIAAAATANTRAVPSVTLDEMFAHKVLDLLKIDVEGYEKAVLRGASGVLRSRERAPRVIYIEVHPYAWGAAGTSGASLLGFLRGCGYEVTTLDGQPVTRIQSYGEIVAHRARPRLSA
jgi:FkbM family methyltransferase